MNTLYSNNRNQPVTCVACGQRVERKMRGQRYCSKRCRQWDNRARKGVVPADPISPTSFDDPPKINQGKQGVESAAKGEKRQTGNAEKTRWEQINAFTWRLYDPSAPKITTPRCHGFWPGFYSNEALAWVFDSGRGWRVRVRHRNGWRHFGNILDFATAKRIAVEALGQPLPEPAAPFGVTEALAQAQRAGLSRGQA